MLFSMTQSAETFYAPIKIDKVKTLQPVHQEAKNGGDATTPTSQFKPIQNKEGASKIEQLYSKRANTKLKQFGYELFGVPNDNLRSVLEIAGKKSSSLTPGLDEDHFVLSSGDTLAVLFTEKHSNRSKYEINAQGLLIIPGLPPIPASGRTLGQVRISIEAAAKNLQNAKPDVSLAHVRQIGVLVLGHTQKPGRHTLTVFHTVLDALMQAGGIKKTGSLRQIKLVRGGRSIPIDLYALLLNGSNNIDMQLRDGDRIIVPSIGPTVAIAGEVKRPGIYETLPQKPEFQNQTEKLSEKLTLKEMLSLAGGANSKDKYRFIKLKAPAASQEIAKDLSSSLNPNFEKESILIVAKDRDKRARSNRLVFSSQR